MFFIFETQVKEDGTAAYLATTESDRNEAEAQFHRILSAAAVSDVHKHGAVLVTEDCITLMQKCYEH